eukprot:scaffold19478_cov100-Cyclotella_meneghiniana.AAC.2
MVLSFRLEVKCPSELRAIVGSLVSSLGGDGDRYSDRITAANNAAGTEQQNNGDGGLELEWPQKSQTQNNGQEGYR